MAVHVLWDFSMGVDATATAKLAEKFGVRIGSVNPNLFQDQLYKFGSACSPDERARHHANRHVIDSINIAKAVGSKLLSVWMADGTNYPGQDDIVARKQRLHGALRQWHDAMHGTGAQQGLRVVDGQVARRAGDGVAGIEAAGLRTAGQNDDEVSRVQAV